MGVCIIIFSNTSIWKHSNFQILNYSVLVVVECSNDYNYT